MKPAPHNMVPDYDPNGKDDYFPVIPAPWIREETFRAIIPWNNMTNKLMYNRILEILYLEFYSIYDWGMGPYEVTVGLRETLDDVLNNSSNVDGTRQNWMALNKLMCETFLSVETLGYSFTWDDDGTTQMYKRLRACFANVNNVTHQIAIYNVLDIYWWGFFFCSVAEEPEL